MYIYLRKFWCVRTSKTERQRDTPQYCSTAGEKEGERQRHRETETERERERERERREGERENRQVPSKAQN